MKPYSQQAERLPVIEIAQISYVLVQMQSKIDSLALQCYAHRWCCVNFPAMILIQFGANFAIESN